MSIIKLAFLALIAIIVFNFFGNKDENYDGAIALPLDTKILSFGDSITYGYGVARDKSYPAQLEALLNTKVINAGVSGEETSAGLRRLPSLLEKYKPQILILCEGGNDILRRKNMLKAKENLAKMIKIAQDKKIYVVLIGVPSLAILTLETDQIYYELADEFNVPLEDNALKEILGNDTLKRDNVHPNEKGYSILSNKIATIVTDNYIPNF
jgi:lysophospholipase L1-like esterase